MFHCSRRKIHEWANTFLSSGCVVLPKVTFPFLQSFPLRKTENWKQRGSELHIGIIPLQKIQIPHWNMNNNNSGRNNDSNRNPVTNHLKRCSSSVTQHVPALLCVRLLSFHFSSLSPFPHFTRPLSLWAPPFTLSSNLWTVQSGSLNEDDGMFCTTRRVELLGSCSVAFLFPENDKWDAEIKLQSRLSARADIFFSLPKRGIQAGDKTVSRFSRVTSGSILLGRQVNSVSFLRLLDGPLLMHMNSAEERDTLSQPHAPQTLVHSEF